MLVKALKHLLFSAFLAVTVWASPSLAAGTIPLALAQQVDINGAPLANCQLSFFVAGTPAQQQDSFADFGLTQKNPWPLTCDQSGRIPMFWLADGLVHARLTDSFGSPIFDNTLQVLGPSSGGGGGGGTVDPTTVLATGDVKIKYGTGPITGFVRLNGLTIGNGTCGCTERANSDAQALFIYLYNADANLVVSGGRTGNALNDFNASKQLTLPDFRGRAMAALSDMGNSDVGLFAGVTFQTGNSTTLGSLLGAARRTLAVGSLPPITSTATQNITVGPPAGNTLAYGLGTGTGFAFAPTGGSSIAPTNGNNWTFVGSLTTSNNISVISTGTTGSAFDSVSTYALVTTYVKL